MLTPTRRAKLTPWLAAELLVDLGHRVLHAERRADRPLGVVLVRDRGAEDRHHVVADVLVDGAAVALHLLPEPAQAAVDQALDRLGVHALRDGRVAGEVGEQDGDLAPLLGQLRRGGHGRSLRRGRGGAAAGAAPSRAEPQDMQNFASAGATVPQDGQRRSSAPPQDMQKRAWAGFSVPQLSQIRAAMPSNPRVQRERAGPRASRQPKKAISSDIRRKRPVYSLHI